jgi:hypothetical protein
MTFRLSQELRDQLGAAAGDRAIGDEIRERLEASFDSAAVPAAGDPCLSEFFRTLVKASQFIELAFGNWRDDPGSFALFRRTVDLLLQKRRPEGEATLRLKPGAESLDALTTDIEQAAPLIALMAEMWIKEEIKP